LVDHPLSRVGVVLKLLEDRILGFILLVWLLPLFALIAIAIKLDSPGPVFFRQYRKGRNNTVFRIFKFRTMQWQSEASSNGSKQTERRDQRVTRVGRFLRRSSLDEIPQLLNVLCGQMSLVGPRPLPVAMLTQGRLNEDLLDNYGHRHRVKPGLTGLAQISGYRGAVAQLDDLRKRVDYDLFYIENWSILLDLQILARTPVSLVFSKDNAF
jgi:polysaccharide biosynthesis protein PslA